MKSSKSRKHWKYWGIGFYQKFQNRRRTFCLKFGLFRRFFRVRMQANVEISMGIVDGLFDGRDGKLNYIFKNME